MRVTQNTFTNSLVDQLNRLSIRQNRLQTQAATGQRITDPDDDPVAMQRVLSMQGEADAAQQYLSNIDRHKELATATFAGIKGLRSIVDRASEIATSANGVKSPSDLKIYAGEINQLIEQALEVANSKNRGDYLFAGTRADQPAFSATRGTDGRITAVTYDGSTDVPRSEVSSGVTLSAQIPGANTSGTGPRGLVADSRDDSNLFQHLLSLRDNLEAGDADAVSTDNLPELRADEDNILFHMGANGAIQSRLDATTSLMKNRALSLDAMVSKEADADLAQTLVRLSEIQTAYQAALQSGGSIMNRSLMDYLR